MPCSYVGAEAKRPDRRRAPSSPIRRPSGPRWGSPLPCGRKLVTALPCPTGGKELCRRHLQFGRRPFGLGMLQAKWTEDAVVDLDAPQIGNLGGAQGGLLERAAQEPGRVDCQRGQVAQTFQSRVVGQRDVHQALNVAGVRIELEDRRHITVFASLQHGLGPVRPPGVFHENPLACLIRQAAKPACRRGFGGGQRGMLVVDYEVIAFGHGGSHHVAGNPPVHVPAGDLCRAAVPAPELAVRDDAKTRGGGRQGFFQDGDIGAHHAPPSERSLAFPSSATMGDWPIMPPSWTMRCSSAALLLCSPMPRATKPRRSSSKARNTSSPTRWASSASNASSRATTSETTPAATSETPPWPRSSAFSIARPVSSSTPTRIAPCASWPTCRTSCAPPPCTGSGATICVSCTPRRRFGATSRPSATTASTPASPAPSAARVAWTSCRPCSTASRRSISGRYRRRSGTACRK